MRLREMIPTNTFTHDGREYDLPKLNKIVKNNPVGLTPISKLIWIFQYDDPEYDQPERIKTSKIDFPILITKWENKLVVLDGLHRIKKAQQLGIDALHSIMVSPYQLRKAEL